MEPRHLDLGTSVAEPRVSLKCEPTKTDIQTKNKYSKIPILRPPLGLSKSGLKDHFWTVPKVVSYQRYRSCRK